MNKPRPRTSPTRGCAPSSATNRSRSDAPSRADRSHSRSRRITAIAARPAARLTALPRNVDVCVPGDQCCIELGPPEDRGQRQAATDPLAHGHQVRHDARSARRPTVRPVRPNPHWISSNTSGMPCVSQSVAEALQEPVRRDDDPAIALDGLDRRSRPAVRPPTPGPRSRVRTSASAPSHASAGPPSSRRPAIRVRGRAGSAPRHPGRRVVRNAALPLSADDAPRTAEIAAGEGEDLAPARQRSARA